jgi:hypothetical protein
VNSVNEFAIREEFTKRIVKELLKTKSGKQILFKTMNGMINEAVESNGDKIVDYLLHGIEIK